MFLVLLLADAQAVVEQPATWVSIAGVAVMGFFAWLNSRDRDRIGMLEGRVKSGEERLDSCEERHEECDKNLAATKTELADTKLELKARDVKDRAELETKIAEQQKQINALGSQTKSDSP